MLLLFFLAGKPIGIHIESASAQKRIVLIEEFTNTGCGPCASWSPVLDSCINYRLGDCIAIKYHSSFPNRGDEFYTAEAEANQARVDFYGIDAVPMTFVDGQELGTRSFGYLNQAINYCQEQPLKYALTVYNKKVTGTKLTADVALSKIINEENIDEIESAEELSKLHLFVAAIEEHIVSATPWPNGERELNYTMRKMLPADGIPLIMRNMHIGLDDWDVSSFNDLSQLGVLAFIQNIETREILATAYSGPAAEGENQLVLQNLYDTPDLICTPDFYGKVIFRNDGANTITNAVLNVSVNGAVKQYPWTGSLNYLDRDTLAFDGFTDFMLNADGKNDVQVWFTDINGSDAVSNVCTSSFSNSVQATYAVQLKLYTDKKPEEITWKLYDSAGDVVREGGPYDGQARKFINVDFELTRDDCYTLEFLDSGGDGIRGAAGNGYYQLFQKDAEGKTKRITQGDYDGSVHDVNFRLDGAPTPPHRLVLFEEFTNTSCDPCAEFSPAFDEVLYRRMGDVVAITYHYNFPSPQDPFYLVSADDVMERANYYGITGVPSLRVNGIHAGAWGYEELLDSYIDWTAQEPAKVDIDTEATLSDGRLKVNVSLLNLNLNDEPNLKLFVAVVEERIEWDTPASNGERSWNYVLRKLLPSSDGQTVEADPARVTPYEYEYTWQLENMDPDELGLVTFVQDMNSGDILGTVYTPRPTGSTSAAKILKVMNTPDRICTPLFTSDLMVRNTGREPLTSATLNVNVNSSLQQTPWTGRLDYLEIDTIHTPAFTDFAFTNESNSHVEIWLSDLNGTEEESVHKTFTIANAYKAQNAVRLTLMTDNAPEEITWTLLNSAGEEVCTGGPYTEARKKQVIDLPINYDDCYTLCFSDAGGNGITGDNGRGYFMLHEVNAEGKTRLMVQQTYTTATYAVNFSVENSIPVGIATPGSATVPGASPSGLYDLQGRPATTSTKAIVISGDHKIIIHNK